MQTIYIDILLCINLVINFLLLSACAFYLHEDVTIKRLMLGAAVGAAGSLTILLPVLPFLPEVLLKAAVGAATVFAAFGKSRPRELMKRCAVFLTATFFFGGAIAAVWYLFTPKDLIVKNSVVYLNISPVALMLASIVCYGAFRLFYTVSGRYKAAETFCTLTLRRGGGSISVPAKIDTGNSLCEPFSQCPVIVIGRRTAEEITPAELCEYERVTTLRYRTEVAGIRFVPFSSVGGRGVLPSFAADEVLIDGQRCTKRVYIALCPDEDLQGSFLALVPCEIV